MKKILFLLLLCVFNDECLAIDGKVLQAWCHQAVEKAPGRDEMIFQDGYCMGLVDGVMALAADRSVNAFCAPSSGSKSMLLRTILGYLDSHPERSGGAAEKLILDALGEAYPCQSSGTELKIRP